MQIIALSVLAKQSLNITLDQTLYTIDLIETNGVMSCNVTRAGAVVLQGARIVAGQALLPYLDVEDGFGNFIFLTGDNNNDLPYWDQFGSTQTLLYASPAELAAVRGQT